MRGERQTSIQTPFREGTRVAPGGVAMVVLLGIMWGTAFPVIRAGLVAGAPPLYFAAVRYLLTAALLAIGSGFTRGPRLRLREAAPSLLYGGFLVIGAYGGLLYLGESSVSGGFAAILTASAPLLGILIGYRWLREERLSPLGMVGMILGFGGVTVLVAPGLGTFSRSSFVGSILVLAAVLAFAGGSVGLRRSYHAPPTLGTLSGQFAIAGALLVAAGVLLHEPPSLGILSETLPAVLYLTLIPGILGYSLYFWVHHRSGPHLANVVGYVNPVTGVLVGRVFFGEAVGLPEVVGMTLIGLGLYVLQIGRRGSGSFSALPTPQVSAAGRRAPEGPPKVSPPLPLGGSPPGKGGDPSGHR
jgi:probable blue pigment (indigoidine) exporter